MILASTEHRSFGARRGVEWWNNPLRCALLYIDHLLLRAMRVGTFIHLASYRICHAIGYWHESARAKLHVDSRPLFASILPWTATYHSGPTRNKRKLLYRYNSCLSSHP